MKTFQISTAPEFYGSDVSKEDGARYADLIAEAAASEFPDVQFETVFSNCTQNQGVDPEGEIQQWINDHWLEIVC